MRRRLDPGHEPFALSPAQRRTQHAAAVAAVDRADHEGFEVGQHVRAGDVVAAPPGVDRGQPQRRTEQPLAQTGQEGQQGRVLQHPRAQVVDDADRALAYALQQTGDPEPGAAAQLERSYLIRAFRKQVGVPPYAYLLNCRVERARTLLASGVPPAEAALEVGFGDQSHLNRFFRRFVGTTPGAYRRSQR